VPFLLTNGNAKHCVPPAHGLRANLPPLHCANWPLTHAFWPFVHGELGVRESNVCCWLIASAAFCLRIEAISLPPVAGVVAGAGEAAGGAVAFFFEDFFGDGLGDVAGAGAGADAGAGGEPPAFCAAAMRASRSAVVSMNDED